MDEVITQDQYHINIVQHVCMYVLDCGIFRGFSCGSETHNIFWPVVGTTIDQQK